MLHVMFWLQLLLVMLILMRSGSISDNCIKLLDKISRFEQHTLQRITELEERNIIVEGQNYVSCRHCNTLICSVMICEWLLYCSCVVTVIQLYVA